MFNLLLLLCAWYVLGECHVKGREGCVQAFSRRPHAPEAHHRPGLIDREQELLNQLPEIKRALEILKKRMEAFEPEQEEVEEPHEPSRP